ncbi:MAG: transglutaminase-like domain-containing protein, partial [Verrucomicrobiota bacterium]
FRSFQIAKDLEPPRLSIEQNSALNDQMAEWLKGDGEPTTLIEGFDGQYAAGFDWLDEKAEKLEEMANTLRELKAEANQRIVAEKLNEIFQRDQPNLYEMGLWIARLDQDDLNFPHYMEAFNGLVSDAQESLSKVEGTDRDKVKALRDFVFKENGFHGSHSEYYSHANSYVNHVLDDREGLPISLSVLFIELARQCGLAGVHGLPVPGQFMVGHEMDGEELLILDVFEQGKERTKEELWPVTRGNSSSFEPYPARDIAARMLRNLAGLEIDQRRNPSGALGYLSTLIAIDDSLGMERFQRALIYVQLNRYAEAKLDLDWLLEHRPAGLDYSRLEQFRSRLPKG